MSEMYYIRWKSQLTGPLPVEEIKEMLADGRLTKHHQVSVDKGMWTPLCESDAFRASCCAASITDTGLADNGKTTDIHRLHVNPDEDVSRAISTVHHISEEKPQSIPKIRIVQQRAEPIEELWFYVEEGESIGPVSVAELSQLAKTGKIIAQSPICKEGEEKWQIAEDVFPDFWSIPSVSSNPSQQNDIVSSPVHTPGTCPLCGNAEYMHKAKSLYGHMVCKKCYYSFANRRQLAFFLDAIGWRIILFPVGFTIGLAMVASGLSQAEIESASQFLDWLLLPIFFCKDCFAGHSLGKLICGVKVIDANTGEPIGIWGSFMRNLPLIVPFMPIIVAFQLCKGHRTGDGWSNTMVIWKKYANHPIFAAGQDIK